MRVEVATRIGLVCLSTCCLLLSCGGGDDGGGPPGPLTFRCADSPVAADTVALVCGNLTQDQVREIEAVIGGPTASIDIKGFSFDVVLDSPNLAFVPGSATQGTLLSQDGDDPLLAAVVSSSDPRRMVVGIHRTDQPIGVQGMAAENVILRFSVRVYVLDALVPDLIRFENAETVDSKSVPIPGITFSDQLLLSVD